MWRWGAGGGGAAGAAAGGWASPTRRHRQSPAPPRPQRERRGQPRALSGTERDAVRALLNSPGFVDKAVEHVPDSGAPRGAVVIGWGGKTAHLPAVVAVGRSWRQPEPG